MTANNTPVAVVLGGCGFLDGTEITEAVSTLINLSQHGIAYRCFAPDGEFSPVNHRKGEPEGGSRNLLVEAARISRGAIQPLSELDPQAVAGLVLPGGYGAAKSLSNFALADAPEVLPELAQVIGACHASQKPIVAMCIAPALLAITLGTEGITLTIGSDEGTAAKLESLGARHQTCAVTEIAVDEEHRLITTPAYMYEKSPAEVHEGIGRAIGALATWLGRKA